MLLAVSNDDLMALIFLNSLEVKPNAFNQKQRTDSLIYVCKGKEGQVALRAKVSKEGDTVVKIEFYPVPCLERAATNCCEENLGADQSDVGMGHMISLYFYLDNRTMDVCQFPTEYSFPCHFVS